MELTLRHRRLIYELHPNRIFQMIPPVVNFRYNHRCLIRTSTDFGQTIKKIHFTNGGGGCFSFQGFQSVIGFSFVKKHYSASCFPLPSPQHLLADGEDLPAQAVVAFNLVGNFFTGVHHGGVIASAQCFTNLRQGKVANLAHQVHGHLTR